MTGRRKDLRPEAGARRHPGRAARTIAVRGAAAPETARGRYARTSRWSQWAPQIRGVDPPDAPVRPGLEGRVRGPLGLRVRFRVEEVRGECAAWTWSVRCLGVRARMHHEVLAVPGGSLATLRLMGPLPVVLLYPLLARPALRRLVRS